MSRPAFALVLTLLMTGNLPVMAGSMQSSASIQRAAHDFLAAETSGWDGETRIVIGAPDPRLQLPACSRPLVAELAPGARPVGNTTIGVRCPGRAPWSLYLSARVQIIADIAVAARPLARGVLLSGEDFTMSRQDLAAAPGGALTRPGQLIGKRLKFPVAAGTVLGASMLDVPALVRRGQPVTLITGDDGFEVRTSGEALADGRDGDRVRVRNPLTGRVVEGRVMASGQVRVPM